MGLNKEFTAPWNIRTGKDIYSVGKMLSSEKLSDLLKGPVYTDGQVWTKIQSSWSPPPLALSPTPKMYLASLMVWGVLC